MKYNDTNQPIVCMTTASRFYQTTRPMTVRGVLWHSTAANNPQIGRYIQPADDDPNREELKKLLGPNKYGNDYNHGNKDKGMGMNGWIGKLADGTVATVQAAPWGWAPWGCGAAYEGGPSCNDGWIQFEICEDGLTDVNYAKAVYDEACELTAMLCTYYHLDPHGTVKYKGKTVPVILDHRTSHELGLGNNHGDVKHWFPELLNKYLPEIRDDVAALMDGGTINHIVDDGPAQELGWRTLYSGAQGDDVRQLQLRLMELGYDLPNYGADGDYGNETITAVKKFQKANGLVVDGIFGPASWAKLKIIVIPEAFEIIVTGNAVNVRVAADTSSKIMYVVTKGTTLTALETDKATGWYHLKDGNYISNKYTVKL